METNVLNATWTTYNTEISKEEMIVFQKAMEGFRGAIYTPIAVSIQPVSGINYLFFCNAKGDYPDALNENVLVQIYQASMGIPHITSIKRCD